MNLLIKNVVIFQPGTPHHLQKKDILVENGIINAIENFIQPNKDFIIKDYCGAFLSLGWIDTHLPLTFPGDERRENLETLTLAAKAGGFTDLICIPSKLSPLDTPESLISLKALTRHFDLNFHFIAGVTQNLNGKDLSELGLLVQAGALGFSNGQFPIHDPNLLIRILQYLQQFQLPFIINPHLPIFNDGQVNDSEIALQLGFKGIPKISESLTIVQTLEVLKYVPAKVHFSPVTTHEGWQLIKKAQNEGYSVTADISSNYFYFDDAFCANYNTLAKVFPPYRDKNNQKFLLQHIDNLQGLASLHNPVISEDKFLEFGISEPGIIHLQTSVPIFAEFASLEQMIPILTQKPVSVFSSLKRNLDVGYKANFTIFTKENWTFDKKDNKSLSNNSPFFGKNLSLKIIDTII